MSIRFPDFQVLVSRSDQVPKVNREGDPTGAAGRLAPQVSQEFEARERRVELNRETDRVRDRKDGQRKRRQQEQEKEQGQQDPKGRRHIDLRA